MKNKKKKSVLFTGAKERNQKIIATIGMLCIGNETNLCNEDFIISKIREVNSIGLLPEIFFDKN